MSDFIIQFKPEFDRAILYLKKGLASINTGRADPAVVQQIKVNAYNSWMTLQELASITVPEARVLFITPWDKSVAKEILKALKDTNLNFQIIPEADNIRLIAPQLTEESRKEYVKMVGKKVEQTRITVRQLRDKIKEKIIVRESEKDISEDEKFKLQKELDELTQEYTKEANAIGENKTKEILTI